MHQVCILVCVSEISVCVWKKESHVYSFILGIGGVAFFFLRESASLRQLHTEQWVQLCCHMTQGLIVSLLSSFYHTRWSNILS